MCMEREKLNRDAVRRGREGEECARRILIENGWSVVARNFRGRRGEIDIIAQRGEILAFVEVKTLNRYICEDLQHVVNWRKCHTIIETSKLFIAMNRKYNQYRIRYDLMLIQGNVCVSHMEGAFVERDEKE